MAPLEVMQLLIVVTSGGVPPLEVVEDPTLEVVLYSIYVVPPLKVMLASGMVATPVGLVYGTIVPLCPVSLV